MVLLVGGGGGGLRIEGGLDFSFRGVYCCLLLQGLYGAAFIKLNLLWVKFKRKRFNRFPIPLLEVSSSFYRSLLANLHTLSLSLARFCWWLC